MPKVKIPLSAQDKARKIISDRNKSRQKIEKESDIEEKENKNLSTIITRMEEILKGDYKDMQRCHKKVQGALKSAIDKKTKSLPDMSTITALDARMTQFGRILSEAFRAIDSLKKNIITNDKKIQQIKKSMEVFISSVSEVRLKYIYYHFVYILTMI